MDTKKNVTMKNYISNIISLMGLVLAVFIISSCVEEQEWDGSQYPANSIAVVPTVSVVDDNTAAATVETTEPGIVYMLLQEAAAPAPTDSFAFPELDDVFMVEFDAAGSSSINIGGLDDGVSYSLYTVFTDSYGAPGPISAVSFTTTDETSPGLIDAYPYPGDENIPVDAGVLTLTYNEPVTVANASGVHLVDAFDESDLGLISEVTASGNTVSIVLSGNFDYVLDVAIILDAGAFEDLSGNPSGAYYDDGDGGYILSFTTAPLLDMTQFSGVYHVSANEIGYGDGISEYYVLCDGYTVGDGFYIDVAGINGWLGAIGYITLDPVADTLAFTEQPVLYSANYDEDIMITSEDFYGLTGAPFVPGTYAADGSSFTTFGNLFISLGNFGFYEMTFTKANMSEAMVNNIVPDFTSIPLRKR